STPACSSSIWPSWHYYSEDREQVLRKLPVLSAADLPLLRHPAVQLMGALERQLLEIPGTRQTSYEQRPTC
ncbi:hypothetical protein QYY75_21530, partial [Xanthomonas campestris pv. campestris]|nr:hypothetical protein [Xanthomonas campestris pv. campestris]MEA0961821.1 hypothetical protein [Xanthomonas campestris pv. campestris]